MDRPPRQALRSESVLPRSIRHIGIRSRRTVDGLDLPPRTFYPALLRLAPGPEGASGAANGAPMDPEWKAFSLASPWLSLE